jgi:regulator of replication initiation timing
MATTNRAVNVYLPKELEQSVTKYCTEYNITRKDKEGNIVPAWGTAILEILKHYFNEDKQSNLPSNAPSILLDEQIESIKAEIRFDLVPEFNELLKVNLEQLRDRIEALERIAIAPKEKEIPDTTPTQSQLDNLYTDIDGIHHSYPVEYEVPEVEEVIAPIPQPAEPEAVIADEPKSTHQYSDGLTGANLAQRLRRDAGSVIKHYKKGDLPEWSQSLDPAGIAWERKEKLYYPVRDDSAE